MKKILQIFLLLILIVITLIFYNKYFSSQDAPQLKVSSNKENNDNINYKSNLIKNLSYNLDLQDKSKYVIFAEESELLYESDVELVKMINVTAKFIDKDNNELIINADKALFNSVSYNTNFNDNVIVKYKDDRIFSENLDLDFTENMVTIYNDVVYEGVQGLLKTDNVKINLITKNTEIFMNSLTKKVKGSFKN